LEIESKGWGNPGYGEEEKKRKRLLLQLEKEEYARSK
jgi:hypothetical protein